MTSAQLLYHEFISGLYLRHFTPEEFVSYTNQIRKGIINTPPPASLFSNIIPTIWILDLLREKVQKPITLTSIYRSPNYNRAVGGVSNSQHLRHNAIDFKVKGLSPKRVRTILLNWRQAGLFKGGIGTYSTFTHLDTRGTSPTW